MIDILKGLKKTLPRAVLLLLHRANLAVTNFFLVGHGSQVVERHGNRSATSRRVVFESHRQTSNQFFANAFQYTLSFQSTCPLMSDVLQPRLHTNLDGRTARLSNILYQGNGCFWNSLMDLARETSLSCVCCSLLCIPLPIASLPLEHRRILPVPCTAAPAGPSEAR